MDGLLSLMNGRTKVGKIHNAKEHIITTFLPINLGRFQMVAVLSPGASTLLACRLSSSQLAA
jgi:hypothetical protein